MCQVCKIYIIICYNSKLRKLVIRMSKEVNWWDYPQKIKYWNPDIDYVMFIDENGSSGRLNDIAKKIKNNEEIDNDHKIFTITGCIFKRDNYIEGSNMINELKEKYWNNGMYFDTRLQNESYVCFHSRDIRRHDGAFNDGIINHSNFTKDLTNILSKVNCTIISISIDLEKYILKRKKLPIYEIAFDLLLERYIYATDNNKKGIIILESRGKKDDKELLKHINEIINIKGTKGIKTKELNKKIKGVFFNPKWSDDKKATYVGLEITDLFSYPIYQFVKYKKSNPAFEIIVSKINGYPKYKNKGIKLFP